MAVTQAEIEDALDLTGTYSLISGAATITDNTAWGSIGVATPDTAKILLRIVDSTGTEFYRNAGWNAGTYTAPDLSLLDTTYVFTLPTDIAGDYLQGQYTIYAKCQVVEDGETTVVQKTFYQTVCSCCNDIEISVEGGVVAGTTEVRLTDNTNYKTYTNLSRTMILYPPPPSGQANQTGTNVDTIVYSGTVYTGVWQWKLTSDITYTDAEGTSTTCRVTGQGTFNVQQSQLCKVLCIIEKYRNQTLIPAISSRNATILTSNYLLAMSEFQLARDSYICGKSQTIIDAHVQKVYTYLGVDEDCDCGCDDGTSQPLLSVTTVDGTDGTDGSVILFGSGAPAGGTGAVGDSYINTANGDMYLKTGASTWTFQLNIKGTAGASGTDGSNGVAVLHNDISDSATTGTSMEILKTYSMPAATLSTNDSYLEVEAVFTTSTANATFNKQVGIFFNGNNINTTETVQNLFIGQTTRIVIRAKISRFSNTSLRNYTKTWLGQLLGGATTTNLNDFESGFYTMGGVNLTTTGYDITARADSDAIGDITCRELTVNLYVK